MTFAEYGKAGPYTEPTRKLDPLVYDLRKLRYQKGISTRLLAQKMGYEFETLKKVEAGVQNPSFPFLRCWVEALGVRITLEVK